MLCRGGSRCWERPGGQLQVSLASPPAAHFLPRPQVAPPRWAAGQTVTETSPTSGQSRYLVFETNPCMYSWPAVTACRLVMAGIDIAARLCLGCGGSGRPPPLSITRVSTQCFYQGADGNIVRSPSNRFHRQLPISETNKTQSSLSAHSSRIEMIDRTHPTHQPTG